MNKVEQIIKVVLASHDLDPPEVDVEISYDDSWYSPGWMVRVAHYGKRGETTEYALVYDVPTLDDALLDALAEVRKS